MYEVNLTIDARPHSVSGYCLQIKVIHDHIIYNISLQLCRFFMLIVLQK